MKKVVNTSAIILCLFFFHMPFSFGQDTQKEKPKKEANKEDMDDEGDIPNDENAPAKKKKTTNNTTHRVAFGIEAGVNLAVLDIDNNNSHINIGAIAGVLVDIRMFGWFYLQPGVFYVMNGGNNISEINGSNVNWNVNTIEVPIDIVCKFGRGGTRFFIGAGAFFGNNISGNSSDGNTLKIGSDYGDQLKLSNIGVDLNLGVELRNGLFFRIREQRGLSNLQPTSNIYSASSIYTASDAITVGFLFGKNKKHKKAVHKNDEYIERRM